jgi:hypothetical protein
MTSATTFILQFRELAKARAYFKNYFLAKKRILK